MVETGRDFSRYDAYLDALPVLYQRDGAQKATATLQLRPTKADTGQSEFEARPDFGDWFAQGDFSAGMGQRFYHKPSRNVDKYLFSEGFDISEPGVLRHLNDTGRLLAGTFTGARGLAVLDEVLFIGHDPLVYASGGPIPSPASGWSNFGSGEDPDAGEVMDAVFDLESSGELLFAALGDNGVHTRTTGGTWDHYQPDGSTDLDTGDTRIVRWLKDRLMVVGNEGRSIYEVVADSTPTAIETLRVGWRFEDVWEAGPFIMAAAVSAESGLSRIHTYGLNSGATAIEKKTSTPMPKGTLVYSGIGAQGRIFLGGGRLNADDGKNSCIFEALANETGELQYLLIAAEETTTVSDHAVRCITATNDSILFGWGRSESDDHGGFVGLARYNLARNAFSLDLEVQSPVINDRSILDIVVFKDHVIFIAGDVFDDFGGLNAGEVYIEELGIPVDTATLVTSVADWNTTSRKVWDLFEVTHHALPASTSIVLAYTTENPDEDNFTTAITSDTDGAITKEARVEDILSPILALKITSTASATEDPEFLAFAVRSTPAPANTEWRLVRTIRVLDRDRKDRKGEPVMQDPRTVKTALEDLAHTWVTLHEPGVSWVAFVEDVMEIEPANPEVSESTGTSEREAYYVELRMVARRSA